MTTTSLPWRVTRVVLLVLFAAFFALPLLALLNFSTKDLVTHERTGSYWTQIFDNPVMSEGIRSSLELAGVTMLGMVVLLVPTMIWVRLRVPRATRLVEFICLLPLTIPALVIVPGLGGVYAWVEYLVSDSTLTLAFVYVVLVLPYSYRAIDSALSSIDSTTLAEAARSLGAGWFTVIVRVIVPNIWAGILNAAFISVALVLGEFTIASLRHFNTLPVAIVLLGKGAAAPVATAAALGSLVLAFLLLIGLSLLDRRRHQTRETA